MENYEKMIKIIEDMKVDLDSFYEKGNKSAGTRVRSHCQELKKTAQDLRVHVQETKNANS
jgi:hypothetical protein